jgi:hypothetical protein
MIGISGQTIGRISEKFINHDVTQRASTNGYRDRIAFHAISSDKQTGDSGSSQVSWYDHMNLVEARQTLRAQDRFCVDRPPANVHCYVRSITNSSGEDQQPQAAIGRIKWSGNKRIGIEDHSFTMTISVGGENARSRR